MFVITADELPRFMACHGSRHMHRSFPLSAEGDMTTRDEGIAAHHMIAMAHRKEFTVEELIDRKALNGVYMSHEMAEYVQQYLSEIGDRGTVEVDTSFEGNGYRIAARADHIYWNPDLLIADPSTGEVYSEPKTLHIDDFKYGWRLVEPFMHWTLIAHAIGYCETRNILPHKIVMTIHQPRPHHRDGKIRSWKINCNDLTQLKVQLFNAIWSDSRTLATNSHCHTCSALATCPAARAAAYNAIDISETVLNEQVENDDLTFHIDQLRRAQSMIDARLKATEELAVHRLRNGAILENYSVESTLTNRQWKDGVTADMLMVLTGKQLTAKPKLIPPAQAEKQGVDKTTVAALSERIPTGYKLVRVSATAKAQKIFGKNPIGEMHND